MIRYNVIDDLISIKPSFHIIETYLGVFNEPVFGRSLSLMYRSMDMDRSYHSVPYQATRSEWVCATQPFGINYTLPNDLIL